MRLAVLPAVVIAVLSTAVVVFVLLSQVGTADAATWGVLVGAAVLGCSCLVGAVVAANTEARVAARRYASLQRIAAGGQSDLQDLLLRLDQGERLEQRPFAHHAPPGGDALDRLAYEITRGQWQAGAAVVEAAQLARSASEGSEEKVEVFVNLARRLQSLVHRSIEMLDQLENEVEDPELLKGLFHVDHLTTRIRRHAENLAVLGGAVSRRQWSRPVTLTEVLRSAIAEVERYPQVKLVPPIEGTLRGHAVADIIHLLAELVENATMFSDPGTQVLLRSQGVTAGLAVEVEDRGLGIPAQEQTRINALLAEPNHVDVSKMLADGRIGLFVVSALARRHGIAVQLRSNIYGGIQAVVVIPNRLLGDESVDVPQQAAADMPRPAPVVPAQPPATQAAPAAQTLAAPPAVAQPLPEARPLTMSTSVPQYHSRTAEPAAPRDHRGPAHDVDAQDGRPQLPKRRAQEHLVPELRDTRSTRMTGDEQEMEPTPGLAADFTRGFNLADDAPGESPANSSR
ncbi:sensor histidine kinase [Streptomyces sp. NPDC000880]